MPLVTMAALVAMARAGRPVSFPTDTVPALAAVPTAASQIYTLKGRSETKPLILMAATAEALWPYVSEPFQPDWQTAAGRYWPGSLTLVLPASACVPASVNPQQDGTIGLRVPRHPLALAILQQTGPLATTSANLSGQPPLTNPTDLTQTFPGVFVLDRPAEGTGTPSTVVAWTASQGWHLLRAGGIPFPLD